MSKVKIEYTIDVSKGGQTEKKTLTAEIPTADLDHFKKKYKAKEVKAKEVKAKAEPKETK